ncbi:MAG: cobalamin-dependent protein [Magnetococcales bacterium]|nr:cobalamin-dependent protein [Magnetococcales bacterium]
MTESVTKERVVLFEEFRQALEACDRGKAEKVFLQTLDLGSPLEMVESLIVPTLERIGGDWETGRIALSQVYMSGRLCEDLMGRILPVEGQEEAKDGQPRRAIVVLNDYHMLGKRIVYSVLRASGFHLMDYGRLDTDELVARIISDRVDELLISVLMLPSALKVRKVRHALKARSVDVRILVGGAPFLFDPELWREMEADAMGKNAADGIRILRQWQGEKS